MSKKVLVTTTALLDDRKILYSSFLDEMSKANFTITVASSAYSQEEYQQLYKRRNVALIAFPQIKPLKERYQWMRRVVDAAIDRVTQIEARLSQERYNLSDSEKEARKPIRKIGWLIYILGLSFVAEKSLISYLSKKIRLAQNFDISNYDLLVVTGPNRKLESMLAGYFRSHGKQVAAYIHSMDNLSTKGRMFPHYDAFFVWSEEMKRQLLAYYPYSRPLPIHIVGACQYDVFYHSSYLGSKNSYLKKLGFDERTPTILYAMGSPNFIEEHHAIPVFLEKLDALGKAYQVLIRPHPQFSDQDFSLSLRSFSNLQLAVQSHQASSSSFVKKYQGEEEIKNWVDTIRHVDMCINLSSSIAIDCCVTDTPVINLNFDPAPDKRLDQMIKEINYSWEHFSPVVALEPFEMVESIDEIIVAVQKISDGKDNRNRQREEAAAYVLGYLDGQCGQRWFRAINQVLKSDVEL